MSSQDKPQVKKQKPNPNRNNNNNAQNKKPQQQKNKTNKNQTMGLTLTNTKQSEHAMFDFDISDDEPNEDDQLVQLKENDILQSMQEQFHIMKQQHNADQNELLNELQKSQAKQTNAEAKKRKQMANVNEDETNTTTNNNKEQQEEINIMKNPLIPQIVSEISGIQDDQDDAEEKPLPYVDSKEYFNPFYQVYLLWKQQVPKDMDRIFDPSLNDNKRKELIDYLPTISQRQYAWAIPTEETIKMMYHFGPIIEIGAGKGYWGYLLRKYAKALGDNCKMEKPDDIYVGFDCTPSPTIDENCKILNLEYQTKISEEKKNAAPVSAAAKNKKRTQIKGTEPMRYVADPEFPSWTHIDIGDSTELKKPQYQNHTLFLCYPDDFEYSEKSLAYDCLKKFKGEYIITVGEFLGETRQENPFGRSADGEFQQHLCDQFHKILHVTLPSWPSSHDSFIVWKRTTKVAIDKTEDDDGIIFRYIPVEEKLAIRQFADCCGDLLESLKAAPVMDPVDVLSAPPTSNTVKKNNAMKQQQQQSTNKNNKDDNKKGKKGSNTATTTTTNTPATEKKTETVPVPKVPAAPSPAEIKALKDAIAPTQKPVVAKKPINATGGTKKATGSNTTKKPASKQ